MKFKLFLPLYKWDRIQVSGLCLREVRCPESAKGANEKHRVSFEKIPSYFFSVFRNAANRMPIRLITAQSRKAI